MLREETDSESTVQSSVSITNVELSAESFNKSRFSSTIWSNQSNSRFKVHIYVYFAEDDLASWIADFGFVQSHKVGPNVLGVRKFKCTVWVHQYFSCYVYFLNSFDSTLNQSGTFCVGPELVYELLNVGNFVKLALTLLHLIFISFRFCLFKLIEVSPVVSQFSALEVDDFVANCI